MQAQKLIVETGEYKFPVWEYPNGAILVPCESTHDVFYNCRDEVQCNSDDVVVSVTATGQWLDWTVEEVKEAITASVEEFGDSDDNAKIKELLFNSH